MLSDVRVVVRFPNQKTVSVAVVRKCGTSTVYSVLGYPRLGKITRTNKAVLASHNEFWISNKDCPFNIDFKFAIVRDPVDRMYSIYKQRILSRNVEDIKNEVTSWDMFVNNFYDIKSQYADIASHSYLQTEKLGCNPNEYNFICNTNQISTFFIPKISEISGVDIPNTQLKRTKKPYEEITKKHIKLIKKYFKEDYKCWGNYFQ